MLNTTETLDSILRRYNDEHDDLPDVLRVRFSDSIRTGSDPLQVLPYLTNLGFVVRCIDDLLQINSDDTEEELHSFRVAEGVVVVTVSNNLWLLFENDAP